MEHLLDRVAGDRDRLLQRVHGLEQVWARVRAVDDGRVTDDHPTTGLVTEDLGRARAALQHREYTIGLFGLVKRGKSTLLNALLGAAVSHAHATPETAVPVHATWGPTLTARIVLADGDVRDVAPHEAREWTSQKLNPGNRRGVVRLEWEAPLPVLRHGIRLVDTPGLDDAEADETYTRRTLQELDAVDAGIVVFLSPPTVGATEMRMLRRIADAGVDRTLLVANMVPQHHGDPASRAAVLDYVSRRVSTVGQGRVALLAVSAEEAFEARRTGDLDTWRRSGGADLLASLDRIIDQGAGCRTLHRAAAAVEAAADTIRSSIDLRLRVLADPSLARGPLLHAPGDDHHDDRLAAGLDRLTGIHLHLRSLVDQCFLRARTAIAAAQDDRALDRELDRARREIEVVTEDAFRTFRARLAEVDVEVAEALDDDVESTLHGVGRPHAVASADIDSDAQHAIAQLARRAGAAANVGSVTGGTGMAVVGAVVGGPIGLVAGALAGWRLGDRVVEERSLRRRREEVTERLDDAGHEVLAAFDRRVEDLVGVVRETAMARRRGFADDLAGTRRLAGRAEGDPELARTLADQLAALRREVDRHTTGTTPWSAAVTAEASSTSRSA